MKGPKEGSCNQLKFYSIKKILAFEVTSWLKEMSGSRELQKCVEFLYSTTDYGCY